MNASKINPILTIEYMCNEKENQFFDRKSAKKSLKEMANHISGFANASGGTLVIGISDDGNLEGFQDYQDKYNEFLKIAGTDYLKTVPNYQNETIDIINNRGNSDKILLIHINPSPDILIRTVKDEIFLRQGDSTNKLSLEQVKVLEYDRQEISFENQLNIRSEIQDIDLDMVQIYKVAIGVNDIDSLDLLRARKFLVKKDGKEYLTNSGVLLFSKDPSVFFPSARVRVIKFEGTKMETGRNLNIVKEKTFALPLYKVIKESLDFVDTQLREFTHLSNDGTFITVPEYPKFAWEERNYKCSIAPFICY